MSTTPTLPKPQPCGSCRTEIIWAATDDGKLMPIEPDPSPRGNVALYNWAGQLRANSVPNAKAAAMRAAGREMFLSHFVNCPHAETWRKK